MIEECIQVDIIHEDNSNQTTSPKKSKLHTNELVARIIADSQSGDTNLYFNGI